MIYRSTGFRTYASRVTRSAANHESSMGSFMEMAGSQCLTGIAQWSSRPCIERERCLSEAAQLDMTIKPSLTAPEARFGTESSRCCLLVLTRYVDGWFAIRKLTGSAALSCLPSWRVGPSSERNQHIWLTLLADISGSCTFCCDIHVDRQMANDYKTGRHRLLSLPPLPSSSPSIIHQPAQALSTSSTQPTLPKSFHTHQLFNLLSESKELFTLPACIHLNFQRHPS
ncbi:hypothetical protein Pst134EA_002958 [Puccinia striiformis f. sp. tritici]|uniref:hypothetical protein n=1 Tax=Puccinia striiformis f. sp. tritici TaxID=168172 RepID=UPI002007E570|nr:hypothetical protein Pst134EA_002958 [Puccinia striiformis f. sp. tritici]KAH9464500.1 hypothetical protein Pst134EB_004035 [Puccinia striiformis f. sp. tritici]KAH9472336.1 hypothetical protein Pst134EA_002958 [Puccinia striiformis f. sp. tritici]